DTQAHGASGKIDVISVLGPGGIALRPLVTAEIRKLLLRLPAEQILDGVVVRRGMRLYGDAILRPQHSEIEHSHDGRERGRGCLMPADLESVRAFAQVVGVVNRPT